MALTQVREPPDVAQSHAEAHAGEQILGFVVPLGPVARLLLLHPLQVGMRGDAIVQPWVRNLQRSPPNHSGVCRSSPTGKCGWWDVCFACAKKLSRSLLSLWVLPHLYNLGRGAERFPLTYGTAVISSSLQSVLYYIMSAILRRCDHLKTVNTLHMMSSSPPPSTSTLLSTMVSWKLVENN